MLLLFRKKFLRDDISKLSFYYGDGYFYKQMDFLKNSVK